MIDCRELALCFADVLVVGFFRVGGAGEQGERNEQGEED